MARLKLTKTKTQRLADALIADRNRTDNVTHNVVPCRSCGSTFIYKGRLGDLNGNFCSLRCQDWYAAGNASIERDHIARVNKTPLEQWRVVAGPPGVEVGASYYAGVFPHGHRFTSMTMTEKGYRIRCAACSREFESLGLRCCSAECGRRYREVQDNRAVMADVGIEPAAKRRCANPGCGAVIPEMARWPACLKRDTVLFAALLSPSQNGRLRPRKTPDGCRDQVGRFSTSKCEKSA
jgi:hypothetical protein